MKFKYIITPIILILTACTNINNPYKDYIGYWKITDNNEILEIRKIDTEKNEYILLRSHALLKKEDGLNDKELMEILNLPIEKEQILDIKKIPGERLAVEMKSKIIPLTFNKNTNEIYIDETTLKKITESEAKENIKNLYKCHKLALKKSEEQDEYNVDKHNLFYNETSDYDKEIKEKIDNKYLELSKQIPECKL